MNSSCEYTRVRLTQWAKGTPGLERASIEEHLAICPACRELAEALRDGLRASRAEEDPDLTDAILSATTGTSCGSCQTRLLAFNEGGLRAAERELIQLHLSHCKGCSTTATALRWLEELLPAMREMEPGEACTAAILARTSKAPQGAGALWRASIERSRRLPGALREILARGRQFGASWTRRPLFPLEAAYLATLIVLLLFGTAISPFKTLPRQTLAWLQGESQQMLVAGVPLPQGLSPLVGSGLNQTLLPAQRRLSESKDEFLHTLSSRGRPAWTGLLELKAGIGALFSAVLSREDSGVAPALKDINRGFGQFWRGIRHSRSESDESDSLDTRNPNPSDKE